MKSHTVFVSSADSYSDLWPIFFDYFRRYWPDFNGVIYLNTEEKKYSHSGLNIISTKVGKQKSFGITFRKGLKQVPSDNLLLIMIDYLFMGEVMSSKIDQYFDFFNRKDLDTLCLTHQGYPNVSKTEQPELVMVHSPAPRIMFSYQIAFWKKSMLCQMALPHENPWTSEWFGSQRAEKMQIKMAAISDEKYNPIPYNLAGCLHKGKWLEDAILHLKLTNYHVDFNIRGYFEEPKHSFKNRIRIKWMLVKDGLKGSYLDLLKR